VNTVNRRPGTLLIVDDDRALVQMLRWAFEDMGYAVWTAADCREAAACAGAMAFDFALIDYRLPDGDGHALSQHLARLHPGLEIVLMSGDRTAAITEIWDDPAAVAFIDKPVPLRRLHRFFSTRPAMAVTDRESARS
jgi:DNA-binding NtrC family response regulator